MGKSDLRVVHVTKAATIALLVVVSLVMCGCIYYLSGRAYARRDVTDVMERIVDSSHPLTSVRVIAALMPVLADIVTFIPWGFLFFAAVDTPLRGRSLTYSWTFLAALAFASGLALWQVFLLPTRVTTFNDALPNALGAVAGALSAHLRKQVHLRFQ
jgi:VanZ family protein